ncbi:MULTISPECIES: PAS domain S-box protein [unclassified Modicisalibacter]|uniref:PAS domain S-box protein n=1 Tax=unclassified Modicisalibacter TaxID=2679913 RepID=UPI001CC93959|nr:MULTISPECIES: PAS domain S-box protein [unclassified Modicisalibacter]MBZ9559961.1 PAS domain S-box protein [Modicisalibacter sp. R2A 31.J]MBZ9575869.1 PAS domain S-box protein [Modicisalibacter sp. MOD 31.J]
MHQENGDIDRDEAERLAALASYDILDTPPEAEFDAITRLASQLCGTPIALISLVDETRQWFKSQQGLSVCQTPRSLAFCAHAIRQREPLVVHDARCDSRFADNPLVVDSPYIRFYAGIPLEMESGHRLGTLCVIDRQPRELEAAQLRSLEDLARLTVSLIEQRRQKREARTRHALLDSLLEALPEGVVACDDRGELSFFNSRARAWHGAEPERLPPEQWSRRFDLFEADGRTPLPLERIPLRRAWAGETVRDQELCIRVPDQPPRFVACNGRAFFDDRGERLGAVVGMHDITQRKRAEREIAETRAHLQAVIDASTEVAIISTDRRGLITLFNPGAERLLGYTADEVVGQLTPLAFHRPDELEQRAAELSRELDRPVYGFDLFVLTPRPGHPENRDWTYVRRDGGQRRVRLVVSVMQDDAGEPIGYLGMALDLSRLYAVEEALRLSEAQFRTAFDTAPQGMALVSLEGAFIEVNRTLCEMWEYAREVLLKTDFQTLTHPDDLAADLTQVGQLISGEIPYYQMLKRYFTRTGRMLCCQLSVSLVRDGQGRPQYFVSQIQDITEQRQLERLKSEFVAVASHELRTPLTSIKGALDLVNGGVIGAVPAAVEEMLRVAQRNAERLGQLVDDLLDWEKLAADKLAFDLQRHALRPLLEDALDSNLGYAERFGVVLVLQGDESVAVEVDALRFAQVMANLLSNAIKFSPRGETVTVRYRRHDAGVCIEVEDHGDGIPEAFRERVFQHFAQAEAGTTRRRGGTGLGLAITKQLVEHMHGCIDFASTLGQGSVFRVWLPAVLRSGERLENGGEARR